MVSFGVAVSPICAAEAKYVQHLAPGRVGIGAAAVTLVHDDQVEEVGRKLAIDILPFLRPRDSLVEGEVNFVGFVHLALDDFGHFVAEEAEIVGHRLVDQDVPVGQVEDAARPLRPPQPPDDLKRGVGLPGAGRHHQQDAALPLGDGAHRPVDRHLLVVARRAAVAVEVIILRGDLRHLSGHARLLHIAQPKCIGRGEFFQSQRMFHRAIFDRPVMLHETIAVGGIDERHVQHLGVCQDLIHAHADAVVVIFGFDDGEGHIGLVIEEIVNPFAVGAAHRHRAAHDDPAGIEGYFFANLTGLPACVLDRGRNVAGADFLFGELLFAHGWRRWRSFRDGRAQV